MRLKLLACKSMWREFSYVASSSPHNIDITFISFDCRSDEVLLKQYIDKLSDEYDAVILGFGLCNSSINGIYSETQRLIIPKSHDCVSILLGSKERYRNISNSLNGEALWYHRSFADNEMLTTISGNKKNYDYLCLLTSSLLTEKESYSVAQNIAFANNLEYREFSEDLSLISDLVCGNWDNENILVLEKGETAIASYTASVLTKE